MHADIYNSMLSVSLVNSPSFIDRIYDAVPFWLDLCGSPSIGLEGLNG